MFVAWRAVPGPKRSAIARKAISMGVVVILCQTIDMVL